MKNVTVILFFFLVSPVLKAVEPAWGNNLEAAMEQSAKSGKPILLFFTGSDWCGWCKRLQAEVFTKPEFAAWAEKNVVLMEVDFPRRVPIAPEIQQQNMQLQQFFGVQGYPTVWIVNATKTNGQVTFTKLGSAGYMAGGPSVWLEAVNGILKNK